MAHLSKFSFLSLLRHGAGQGLEQAVAGRSAEGRV